MIKIVSINSGQCQTIEITNKISISTICIYGGDIMDILNEIVSGECIIKISLEGEISEYFELNLLDLIKPDQNYNNWNLCIFKLDECVLFPKIDCGKNFGTNQMKISFSSKFNKVIAGILYENLKN